jgi:ubiquinone/menaquinone biosynthesis C-methylase UbiE
MNKERLETTLRYFIQYQKEERLLTYLPHLLPERMAIIHQLVEQPKASLEDYLHTLRIHYLVTDARTLPLPDQSIHFITSNNTFEHIYPDILEGILIEFQRVLRKDGIMSHFIDMSDHFAHLDHTINIYHFLRFTVGQWALMDNTIQPQNRMRISQYRALYEDVDIPVLSEKHRPGNLEEVKATPLKPPFSEMPPEVVAISHSYLVSGNK